MKKILILTGGWILTIIGGILTPIPMPLPFPFPIGITMFLVGCAILTTHSKAFRRGIQYIRHHNDWFSRGLEFVARAPLIMEKTVHRLLRHREGRISCAVKATVQSSSAIVTDMVHRTRPRAHGRRARMRGRVSSDTA